MGTENNNLLLKLYKWADRQGENFITEVFAHLLRHFLQFEPEIAVSILDKITDSRLHMNLEQTGRVLIKTHPSTDQGRPDIEIRYHDFLIFIEVKVDSDFDDKQLSGYRSELAKSGISETVLTTITKYPYAHYQKDTEEQPDVDICWHQIIDWIKDKQLDYDTSRYLANQFIELLFERGVAMEKVSWELKEGLNSFRNLIAMLSEVVASLTIPAHKVHSWDYYGYYTNDNKFFIGIYFASPDFVTVNTEVALKKGTKGNPPIGKITGGYWQNDLELGSEEVHFFSREKPSQVVCLEQFIKVSMDYAKTIV